MSTGKFIKNCIYWLPNYFKFIIYASTNAKRIRKDNLTYLNDSAIIDLQYEVQKLEKENRYGIIIEAGCALGGSALVIASAKRKSRKLYIYDIFGTIPPPSFFDGDDSQQRYKNIISGISKGIGNSRYYGYEEDLLSKVRETFVKYDLKPEDNDIYFIQGLYEKTLYVNQPVSLAHIDCDWYESVKLCLERIVPNLIKNGVIIIDDYFTWSGCSSAVDEYFADKDGYEFVNKTCLHIIKV